VGISRVLAIVDIDFTGEVAVILAALNELDGRPVELESAESAGAVSIICGRVRRCPSVTPGRTAATVTTAGDRRAIHRALAAVLLEPRHRRWRAEHLAAAAVGHDAVAAAALGELGEEASTLGETAVAAGYFARAADLEPDAEPRAWYLYRAGDCWWNAGAYDDARAAFTSASEGSAQPVLRADAIQQLAGLEMYEIGPRYARDLLVEASRAVAEFDIDRAANLLVHAASTSMLSADVTDGLALARDADELARRGNGISGLASSLAVAFLSLQHGDIAAFEERFPALLGIADVILDGDHPQADLFLQLVGMAHVYTERWEAGRKYLSAVVHNAARRDRSATAALASATLAELCWRTGRWDEAYALATSNLIGDVSLTGARVWLLAFRSHLDAGFGRADECRERAGRALALAEPLGLGTAKVWALHALGLLELGIGAPSEAAVHLDQLAAHATAYGAIEPGVMWWQADHVEALIRAGRNREASRALNRFEEAAGDSGGVWASAAAARCRGLSARSIEEAEACFAKSLVHHERLSAPFELGRTLLCRAERRAEAAAAPDPTSDLDEAIAIFDALGAAPWSARARDVGRQCSGPTEPDWSAVLSPAERRVAAAVAEGLTNKDIAIALYVSAKTVEFHLHRIFTKLDVTSRTQLMKRMTESTSP
jgi:DNA-binding CsgD family transcriptional regulator